MKLRLGQPVHASDGRFGDLADIVIDPTTRTITHLVVEPHRRHVQARLVPLGLVSVVDDRIDVALDTVHLHQLQRVAFTDFVAVADPIDVGEGWDIGTQNVVAMPYWDAESYGAFYGGLYGGGDAESVEVSYDRIPKGECEVRRRSRVQTSDEHDVGHVEGLLTDQDHVVGVIVRSGIVGLRHNSLVPISSVARVDTDWIELSIDRRRVQGASVVRRARRPARQPVWCPPARAARLTRRRTGRRTPVGHRSSSIEPGPPGQRATWPLTGPEGTAKPSQTISTGHGNGSVSVVASGAGPDVWCSACSLISSRKLRV